jgi:flagellar motor protein MotB
VTFHPFMSFVFKLFGLSLAMHILQAAEEGQSAAAAAPSKAAQKRARKKAAARAAAATPPTAEPPAAEPPESAEASSTAEGVAVQTVHTACSYTGQGGDSVAAVNVQEQQHKQEQQQQHAPAWALCPITQVCTTA